MNETTIPPAASAVLFDAVDKPNVRVAEHFPGDSPQRQPVHTFYGGAHLFTADTIEKLGAAARRALQAYAPGPVELAAALGYPVALAERIYPRIVDKLTREPVEDFRIDFEDGFGHRPDQEEDRVALAAADEVAVALAAGRLPVGIGIRIKPLNEELKRRSLRTLDLFLTRLLTRTGGTLPHNFVITLPKITSTAQVRGLTSICDAFEYWRGIPTGSLRFEIMIETTQSIFAEDGSVALPRMVAEGRNRLVAAHFGTYDYTAACGITAAHQQMLHPACDFARHVMQVALAGTGIWLSDGATNVMPVEPHRPARTTEELAVNQRVMHDAWRTHADHVRHSLVNGFYQGWDLHPAQLPSRYAAVYAFFLEGLEAASDRLRNFVDSAAQATLVGHMFDDAATGQGLLNYFLRAMNSGAITEAEAASMNGLTLDQLRGRSFVRILDARQRLT